MARLINHVDLTVSDMARSRAFYKPVLRYLGFEVIQDTSEDLVFGDADQSGVTGIALHPARGEGSGIPHNRRAPDSIIWHSTRKAAATSMACLRY